MSTSTVTTEAVVGILQSAVSHLESVDTSASFRGDLDLDSLDLSLFFLNLQETYNVEISDNQTARLDSINDVVAWLQSQ